MDTMEKFLSNVEATVFFEWYGLQVTWNNCLPATEENLVGLNGLLLSMTSKASPAFCVVCHGGSLCVVIPKPY